MRKILVTGGAGFIGSHVVKHLLDAGEQVVVLDDLSGGSMSNLPNGGLHPRLTFHLASVVNREQVDAVFQQHHGFKIVYHLAAYAAENLSHFIRHYNYSNNVLGSINIINACVNNNTKRLVFTSSIAVYGEPAELPVTENTPPASRDPYGVAKYAVELDLKAAYKMFGLEYTIFRPHNVIGVHQNLGDAYRNVAGIFINQTMAGKPMTIFGDGTQTRGFSDVDDVAPHIARAGFMDSCANTVINIGSDRVETVRRVAECVAAAFGVPLDVQYLPPRHEATHTYADHSLAHRLFSINPENVVTLDAAIAKMVAWAKTVGVKATPKFAGIEIEKNLPPSWR